MSKPTSTLVELLKSLSISINPDTDPTSLLVGDRLLIDIDCIGETRFLFSALVGNAPPLGMAKAAIDISTFNYRSLVTAGSSLGLNPTTGDIVLTLVVTLDSPDATQFEGFLTQFIDTAERFQLYFTNKLTESLEPLPPPTLSNPTQIA